MFSRNLRGSDASESESEDLKGISETENPIAENQEDATLTEPDSNEDILLTEETKRNIENIPPRITDIMLPVVLRQNNAKKLHSVFTRWVGAFVLTIILIFY